MTKILTEEKDASRARRRRPRRRAGRAALCDTTQGLATKPLRGAKVQGRRALQV
jgi:hypothetical protein